MPLFDNASETSYQSTISIHTVHCMDTSHNKTVKRAIRWKKNAVKTWGSSAKFKKRLLLFNNIHANVKQTKILGVTTDIFCLFIVHGVFCAMQGALFYWYGERLGAQMPKFPGAKVFLFPPVWFFATRCRHFSAKISTFAGGFFKARVVLHVEQRHSPIQPKQNSPALPCLWNTFFRFCSFLPRQVFQPYVMNPGPAPQQCLWPAARV